MTDESISLHLAKSFRARKAEWLCTLILLGIAINILAVQDPWLTVINGVVEQFTTNTTAGALFGLWIAIISLIALVVNGWLPRRTPYIRAGMSAMRCFVWAQATIIAVRFEAFDHFPVTGVAIFPLLFLFDLFNVFQASWDNEDAKVREQSGGDGA